MVRLWKLPAALVELSIGTTILLVHLGLAARYDRRPRLPGPDLDRAPRRD